MTRFKKLVLAMAAVITGFGAMAVTETAPAVVQAASPTFNRDTNINSVPGALWYFTARKGSSLEMICWTQGPRYDNQYKWFYVLAYRGRDPVYGYVPAPTVSNPTPNKPLCPPW